jgi:uncharacterized protein (TIGR02996 family)
MKPTPECVALLRAIAATPDDDTPRLVFADWLDENSTGDADAARAEFIRLSCTMKSKQRLSAAEGRWLDANVRRLLPTVLKKFQKAKVADGISRSGRNVRIHTSLDSKEEYGDGRIFLHIEYWRGFARRIEYGSIPPLTSLPNIGRELAADEPLAVHASELSARSYMMFQHTMLTRVTPEFCHGRDVWELVDGHDRVEDEVKVFDFAGGTEQEWQAFGDTVVLASVSRAMTAYARAAAGWPTAW